MIVFDLQCDQAHAFEAWFASSTAYTAQCEAGQLTCPFCGSSHIAKAAMAPRLAARADKPDNTLVPKLAALQRRMLEGSRWVGGKFAREARAMAEGVADPATIHGTATADEARALRDDGVSVMPLPFPVIPPAKLN